MARSPLVIRTSPQLPTRPRPGRAPTPHHGPHCTPRAPHPGDSRKRGLLALLIGVTVTAIGGTVGIAAAVGGSGQATGTPATSAQVQQWIAQAEQIMATHGHPAFTPSDTADLIIIIQGESGGNPNTINTWDSNAAAGHPSQGLMQTIPSVFATYALRPGYDTNIDDPVSNIIAGTRYAEATYGSLDNVPGVIAVHAGRKYVGY